MTQIDLYWFKKNGQTILNVLLGLLLVYTLFNSCSKDADLRLAKENMKLKIENANSKINSLANQNLAKDLIIAQADKKADDLEKENVGLRKDKSNLSKSAKSNIAKARNFKNDQIAEYFINRYDLPSDVLKVEKGIQLSDTVSKLAIVDLIGGDGALIELELTQKELVNTNKIVSFKDEIIGKHVEKEVNFNSILAEKDIIIDANKDYSKEIEKSLKKEKRKTTFYKITTLAAIIGGGYLILK